MIKYLIVQLSPDSVSFCYNNRHHGSTELMESALLKDVIVWSMKENLNVQFTFPDEEIPAEYKSLLDTIDHTSIVGSSCKDSEVLDNADVIVFDSYKSATDFPIDTEKSYVVRISKDEFFEHSDIVQSILDKANSLSIVITDIQDFTDADFQKYKEVLESLIPIIVNYFRNGRDVHFNLLTDRILLNKMNNCGAGDESITIAPDGKFYVCPAFNNCDDTDAVLGDFKTGLTIKNPQLYKLDHAPICRICDAFQCRRCVWLNKKTTLEVNTPSHEQCVVAHIERNASKKLLDSIRELGDFLPSTSIKTIDYLDPFEILNK